MANRNSMSRRYFTKHTAGAAIGGFAFPYIIPSSVLGKSNSVAPSNKITIGCVGMRNQGRGDMRSFMEESDAHVIAVCDVDANHLREAKEDVDRRYRNNDCDAYRDFRDLIARDDIDVVQITLPSWSQGKHPSYHEMLSKEQKVLIQVDSIPMEFRLSFGEKTPAVNSRER